jgi:hypothetical protein
MQNIDHECLRTEVLPNYNCNNCEHFISKGKEILQSKSVGSIAVECNNVVHPLEDCILRGFKAHSEQPGSSKTLNK